MNFRPILFILTLLFSMATHAQEADKFEAQAQQAIKEFAETLKSALMLSMQTEGPVKTLGVCKDIAPKIAEQVSEKYQLDIRRTSLKVRNPANKADEWETEVLNKFTKRLSDGEPIKKISFKEQVDHNGQKQWRMMQAIGTDLVCISCHGEKIPEPIQAELNQLYPEDQAKGFAIGSVRGAFSVKQPID